MQVHSFESHSAPCSAATLPCLPLPSPSPQPTLQTRSVGGLAKDLAIELANGTMAVVVETTPEYVRLDANNMMSGKKLLFELEVLGIERP